MESEKAAAIFLAAHAQLDELLDKLEAQIQSDKGKQILFDIRRFNDLSTHECNEFTERLQKSTSSAATATESIVKQKDTEIANLNKQLEEKEIRITNILQAASEETMARESGLLNSKEEIDTLKKLLKEKETRIKNILDTSSAETVANETRLIDNKREIEELKKLLEDAKLSQSTQSTTKTTSTNNPPPPPSPRGGKMKERLKELIDKKACSEGVDDVIYVMLGERCGGKDRMKFLRESFDKL